MSVRWATSAPAEAGEHDAIFAVHKSTVLSDSASPNDCLLYLAD